MAKNPRLLILPEEKVLIYKLWRARYSKRKLARLFDVSRRSIDFIISPDKLKENREKAKERGGWKQYYDKDRRRELDRARKERNKKLK